MIDWKQRCETLEQELISLVHSVSHDLRAPLRAADGFSRALMKRHAADLDPQALDYLQRIRAAAMLMGTHIEAISRLARVSTAQMRIQRLDLAALARGALQELRDAEPERQLDVRIADGLEVEADFHLMRTLMQNLVSNAWKFTRQQPGALIEIGCARTEVEPHYYVRDNGTGFDMSYTKHLFEPFGRLQPGGENEGLGVGLAIARRIVNRHGGRIWAEAAAGQGATFAFTLGQPEVE